MKKVILFAVFGSYFFIILLLAAVGGGGEMATAPVTAFATEEEAYAYQYIGAELGVPWDIALLVDGISAYADKKKDLSDYNPMLTSLQFCILQEEEFIAEEVPVATATPAPSASPSPEPEPEIMWVSNKITTYTGTREILDYIGVSVQDMDYRDATSVVNKINDTAAEKSTDQKKYEVTLLVNPDFEVVLLNLIGLSEDNTKSVLELYDSNYLAALYGYTYVFGDIVLPEIVQGNVSRADLAAVAISLINHPYLLGGKSSAVGAPTGPLDCSGYVDWVYMQCFGVTVGNGTVPEGVAVSGTAIQWYASEEIGASDLKVGDLGFMKDPALMKPGQINHVGIYLGSCNGKTFWIHCAGKAYGTEASPSGRVGISVVSGMNNYNPVDGSEFEPAMKGCRFRFYRRPRFTFTDD